MLRKFLLVLHVLLCLTERSWRASAFFLETCELLDLTHDFGNSTIYWPKADPFRLAHVFKGHTGKFYYEMNRFSASEHGGTHIDAPSHFAENHWTVEQIPLSRLIGEACVIDASKQAAANADYELAVSDLTNWEREHGKISPNCIVLVNFGWSRRWPNKLHYLGTESENFSLLHFPGISAEASRWLIENREFKAIGVDTASTDRGQSTEFGTHRNLARRNVPAFENLANLDQLPARRATFVGMPMKISDGSGAPLRAFAYGWKGPTDPCIRQDSRIAESACGHASTTSVTSSTHAIMSVISLAFIVLAFFGSF